MNQVAANSKFSLRTVVTSCLKMAFVFGLLYWMVSTDKLDLRQLRLFFTDPVFLALTCLFWLIFPVILGSYRWFVLLQGAGVNAGFFRTVQLQMIGFFFNAAIPGAVGGDLVKAIYIVRDQSGRRAAAMLSIFLDRIVGLIGLFTIAFVSSMFHLQQLLDNPMTRSLIVSLFAAMLAVFVFVALVFFPHKDGRDPFERILTLHIPGFGALLKVYQALRSFKNEPMTLVSAWLLSVLLQLGFMSYFWYVTLLVTSQAAKIGDFSVIFPFGALATAIPIAPGGLGVGHFAYEKLYALVGLKGGANVFNVYVLGQLTLNLFGLIPYFFVKSKIPISTSVQV